MSTMSFLISDDPEEGEIVDDDFEDISDNSIIEPLNTGKSVSSEEHFPPISLSSVSESDVPKKEDKHKFKSRHHHRPQKKKRKSFTKRRCSHNYKKYTFSDSDSDEFLDHKLQKQLKAAIHVETKECHRNSLRTRLRAMTKPVENDIYEHIIRKSENDDEEEQQKESSSDHDEDLIQLRLEALRTAMLNKLEHRKKRKMINTHGEDLAVIGKVDKSEIDKENSQLLNDIEPPNKKVCNGKSNGAEKEGFNYTCPDNGTEKEGFNYTSPDEDEDILRAVLLASMSKKITKEVVSSKTVKNNLTLQDSVIPKQSFLSTKQVLLGNMNKKDMGPFRNNFINNNFKSHTIGKMNPIIINVDDSDTDDDHPDNASQNTGNQSGIITKTSEIESSVEKFLKEQRAKVEAEYDSVCPNVTKKKIPELGTHCDSTETVKSSNPTELCRPMENKNTPNKPMNRSVILEKSAVKLLPRDKQIEYHKLLQKLKNAKQKPNLSSKIIGETKPRGISSKKFVRNKISVKENVNKAEHNLDFKSDARTLHFALKEMQQQKNGRLQIEEKYVVLTPIIKKINEATTERKKYDQEVKKLLQELAKAKTKLRETHLSFSMHVQELIKQKREIESSSKTVESNQDQLKAATPRASKPKELTFRNKKQKDDIAFTSTPKKNHSPLESFEATAIPPVTPTDTPDKVRSEVISNSLKQELGAVKKQTGEMKTSNVRKVIGKPNERKGIGVNSSDTTEEPINPGDPNDIDRIYKTRNVVPEYRSPLDCVKRKDWFDPLAIMCPYDVNGSCRDAECIYKHYSR